MTARTKEILTRAAIDHLVDANKFAQFDSQNMAALAKPTFDALHCLLDALTADREALAEQREVGYGLYLEFNGELHLEYPVEASYDDCVLRLQEYDRNRGYEIRACYIIPTGLEK